MDYLTKFNQLFCDMVGELVTVFPSDPELRLYKFAVDTTIASDAYYVSRMFNEYIATPYGDKIQLKDETFFVEKDYTEYAYGDQNTLDVFKKLKTCWMDLNEDNRAAIWKYLTVMLNLNKKIYQ